MFNFQTQTLIHSINDVVAIDAADDKGLPAGEVAVAIKNKKFFQYDSAANVKTKVIYKREAKAAVKEVATIALAGVTLADLVGKVLTLKLDVKLLGNVDAEYQRWDSDQGTTFYAEYFVNSLPASIAALATALATAFTKGMQKNSKNTIVITASGTNLVVTAQNEYQRLHYVGVEYVTSAVQAVPTLLALGSVTTHGAEAQGSGWNLLKNSFLPTHENTTFMNPNHVETPIIDALYNQYTIVQVADRANLGMGAVGMSATSTTEHIVYVLESLEASFEAIVEDILDSNGIITVS